MATGIVITWTNQKIENVHLRYKRNKSPCSCGNTAVFGHKKVPRLFPGIILPLNIKIYSIDLFF